MKNQSMGPERPKNVPELAKSFVVEFLTSKYNEVTKAMGEIGKFSFKRSGSEGENENSVYFEGERKDGTKIRITIEKGKDYKSPAEIEPEMATEK